MKLKRNSEISLLVGILLLTFLAIACSSDSATPTTDQTITPSLTPTETVSPTSEPVAWTGDSLVEISSGLIDGSSDEFNTWVWKAIPYAKPPVGDLRWKAPRDPEPWGSVLSNDDFCEMCIQYDALAGTEVWGSEDCLYLNVWRPQTGETGLPVYVWIHGGGNSIGSANQTPTYMGARLASKSNMVFVSMNYRLGPFGWFTHPSLKTGNELDDSGNYGTLDIIKSLEWIQDNIEAFGGDPNTVIVTGESAGAVNIFSLLMSPQAQGLFHRALIQSGMQAAMSLESGEKSAENVIAKMLVNDDTVSSLAEAESHFEAMSDSDLSSYLHTKTPTEIMECYEQRGFGMIDSPFIFADGNVIVAEGTGSFTNGTYPNKIPIMIGSTKEELKMFLFSNEELVQNEELYQVVTSYGSDLWKLNGVDDICRKITSFNDQPEVYAYQFKWGAYQEDGSSPIPSPYDLTVGCAHSLDNPFFLGNPSFNVFMTNWVFTEENRPGREALTDAMMAYTAQFARTGNPNLKGSGLPEWQSWKNGEGKPKCLLLDADLTDTRIKMSNEELTLDNIINTMKQEVNEPLFSQAIEFIKKEWTVSHLLEGIDVDYTPQPTEEPTAEPTPSPSPEPSPTNEPDQPIEGLPDKLVYNVTYENEGTIEETVWTSSITGHETIDGVDCYISQISFDQEPVRVRYIEMGAMAMDITLNVTNMITWIDKTALLPIKAESTSTAMGFKTSVATEFTYDGDYGKPFTEGKTWSYSILSTPSMGEPITDNWTSEVVGMEEVTVPAGTFNCHKVVHTKDNGDTTTDWWANVDGYDIAVKMLDEANWNGTETRELVSFSK